MYNIQTLNKIAACGTDLLDKSKYAFGDDIANPDAILVRSAAMHDMELGSNLLAIARAGAGVNNIPIDKCSEKGVVVFNTPGANANGVKELVIAGMFLASRDIIGGINWVQENEEDGNIAKDAEKAKKAFAGCELEGKKLGVISAFLANCNAKQVVDAVKGGGAYVIEGEDIALSLEDLQIFTESANGFVAAEDKGLTVALDTNLTDELIFEGIERELVSKIQNMRKEAGFDVTDRISVRYKAEGKVKTVLARGAFAKDVLAESIDEGSADGFTKEQNVNGEKVVLTLIKK